MTPPKPTLWSELKRRKVVRAGAWYVVAAAAVLQVLDVVVPALLLPDWTMTFFVVLALAGLPTALVLAWAFDLTPGGLQRSGTDGSAGSTVSGAPSTSRGTGASHKLALLSVLLVVLGIGGWVVWRMEPAESNGPVDARGSVAVLPFSVQGGEEVQLLGEGMVDLLSTKLDAGPLLRATDPRALFAVIDRMPGDASQEERAGAVVEQLGAGAYVLGSVVEFRDRLQLRASLYHPGADSVITATVEGASDALFDLVDRLAGQLLVGETGGDFGRIAGLTTSSLPALKAYLRGERAIRQGRFPGAMEEFEAAIHHDSTFALAYYKLSIAAEWAGRGDALDLAHAAPYLDRLNPHTRDLIRASVAWRSGQAGVAERLYRSVLARHPDDVEAWFQLAEIRFHSGPLQGQPLNAARGPWEKVLDFEPENPFALLHLARIAGAEYRTDEVAQYLVRIRAATEQGDRRRLEAAGVLAGLSGDPDMGADFVRHLTEAADPGIRNGIWYGIGFSRDLALSRRIARVGLEENRSPFLRNVARLGLAYVEAAAGDLRPVMEHLEEASRNDPDLASSYAGALAALPFLAVPPDFGESVRARIESWTPTERGSDWATFFVHEGEYPVIKPYLLGLLAVEAEDLARADRALRSLEARVSARGNRGLGPDLIRGLQAGILRARGNPEQALEALTAMQLDTVPYHLALNSSFIARAHERFLRAELLYELGRLDEALRAYEAVIDQSALSIVFLAPTHLRRGEIHEARGEDQLAAEQYARFLALWKNPAPTLQPVVDDVRRRLTRLSAEPAA